MAIRNDFKNSLWQKLQKESVSWGMLALLMCGLAILLAMMTMYSRVQKYYQTSPIISSCPNLILVPNL